MNKLAIIDADGLAYHSLRENLYDSFVVLNDKIYNIFEKTGATYYVMFISTGKYFRHRVDSNYKAFRSKYQKPKWIDVIKEYMIAEWNVQWMKEVEADDLCAYWYRQELYHGIWAYQNVKEGEALTSGISDRKENFTSIGLENGITEVEKILCSPDKDLLMSIPGRHFKYSYKLVDKTDPDSDVIEGEFIETSGHQTDEFCRYQMVVGDSADGIIGLKGKGEKYWLGMDDHSWKRVLHEYIIHFGNEATAIYEFQKNYRLLHLLNSDADFIREVNNVPSLPVISSVDRSEGKMESNF